MRQLGFLAKYPAEMTEVEDCCAAKVRRNELLRLKKSLLRGAVTANSSSGVVPPVVSIDLSPVKCSAT